ELRTPIFSLGGFLELLQDEELDPETRREFLATMSEQVERLSRLATDLLDLSRLDAGPMRLEREPVRLDDVARALRDEFSAVARRVDHPLSVLVDEEGVGLADRERVLQIGRALVGNALPHTPPRPPVPTVGRAVTLAARADGLPAAAAGVFTGKRGRGDPAACDPALALTRSGVDERPQQSCVLPRSRCSS